MEGQKEIILTPHFQTVSIKQRAENKREMSFTYTTYTTNKQPLTREKEKSYHIKEKHDTALQKTFTFIYSPLHLAHLPSTNRRIKECFRKHLENLESWRGPRSRSFERSSRAKRVIIIKRIKCALVTKICSASHRVEPRQSVPLGAGHRVKP